MDDIGDLGPCGIKGTFQNSAMLWWFLKDAETIGEVLGGEKIAEKKDLKHRDQFPHKYLTKGISLEMIRKYFSRRYTKCTVYQLSEIQWNVHGCQKRLTDEQSASCAVCLEWYHLRFYHVLTFLPLQRRKFGFVEHVFFGSLPVTEVSIRLCVSFCSIIDSNGMFCCGCHK